MSLSNQSSPERHFQDARLSGDSIGREQRLGGVERGNLFAQPDSAEHDRLARERFENQPGHAVGANTATGAMVGGKPTTMDKIVGETEVIMGKLTRNPHEVAIGDIRKTQGKAAAREAIGQHPAA